VEERALKKDDQEDDGKNVATTAAPISAKSQFRRAIEVTLFVGAWMLIGYVLRLDANSYLLAGIPITLLFQKLIARSPITTLWVRSASHAMNIHDTGRFAMLVALGFAAFNSIQLYGYALAGNWIATIYEIVAIVGSIPLAYSLSNFTRSMLRPLLMCLASAGAIGVGYFFVSFVTNVYYLKTTQAPSIIMFALTCLFSLATYLPITFMLEEVSFRGAFDSHIFHPGEGRSKLTALYVSLLWGAWHIPVTFVPTMGLSGGILLLIQMLAFQGVVGFFLSVFWRRSENLLVPGSVHAIIDSVRNGLAA
jgi:hypothetical protein